MTMTRGSFSTQHLLRLMTSPSPLPPDTPRPAAAARLVMAVVMVVEDAEAEGVREGAGDAARRGGTSCCVMRRCEG